MADEVDKPKSAKHIQLIGNKFRDILKEPELFLSTQPDKYQSLCKLLQQVYQLAIRSDATNAGSAEILPELVIDDMHEEQIWQQLELRNNIVIAPLVDKTSHMNSIPEEHLEIRLKEDEGNEEEDPEEEEESIHEEEQEENHDGGNTSDDEIDKQRAFASKKKLRSSIVDDKFFKLGEMEAFLEAEEAKEMQKQKKKYPLADDDGIDYFDENLGEHEDEEEDEESNPDYKDFFDVEEEDNINEQHENHKSKEENNLSDADNENEHDDDLSGDEMNNNSYSDEEFNEEPNANNTSNGKESSKMDLQPDSGSDSEDEEPKEQPKSSFEMRQDRLQQRIRDYEEEVLGEKPWQLKGEIQATNRPQNSLLEEILEFESTTRPAPVITEETTRRLEDIIRQRIKDQAWDDVKPKVKPILTPQDYRKQLVLDQEKSKLSLAQIYEKEYQNELEKLDPNHGEKEKEEPKEHKEIRSLMRTLFVKLDALSNFHFTPKPVAPEAKIITNTPAIDMEEVAPVAVSDATLLAPEEILKPKKQPIRGESERTKTDKNRERRKKKQKQRAIYKALEAKDLQKQKMGISLSKKEENAKLLKSITKHRNVEKITASADQSSLKSSKAFFSKLQDTTMTAKTVKAAKKKADSQSLSAKKLKL